MEKDSKIDITAWVRIARAHTRILDQVEKALKLAKLKPLSWYDVLLELERSGESGLRHFELEEKLLLPQYSVSRLVDRIESAGYLSRTTCSDDLRGQVLHITKQGKQVRQRMWPVYRDAIRKAVGDKLSDTETRKLADILSKLS